MVAGCVLPLMLVTTLDAYAENDKPLGVKEILEIKNSLIALSNAGDANASAKLGALYLSGSIGSPDYINARKYLELGAEVDISSRLALGHLYMNGLGGEIDAAKAEREFSQAAKQGSLEGLFLSSKLTLGREATQAEIRNAVNQIVEASKAGFPPAIAAVGDFYRTGTFFSKSPEKAVEHFMVAADRGYYQAYSTVAEMKLFSELGYADIAEAKRLYRLAIENGVIKASYSLAFLVFSDENSSESELEDVFRLAKISALSWDERSQYLLGLMYYKGKGVKKDNEEAYFWLELAASAGVFESHHIRALAASEIEDEKLVHIKQRAKEWFVANHNKPHNHIFINNANHQFN